MMSKSFKCDCHNKRQILIRNYRKPKFYSTGPMTAQINAKINIASAVTAAANSSLADNSELSKSL